MPLGARPSSSSVRRRPEARTYQSPHHPNLAPHEGPQYPIITPHHSTPLHHLTQRFVPGVAGYEANLSDRRRGCTINTSDEQMYNPPSDGKWRTHDPLFNNALIVFCAYR